MCVYVCVCVSVSVCVCLTFPGVFRQTDGELGRQVEVGRHREVRVPDDERVDVVTRDDVIQGRQVRVMEHTHLLHQDLTVACMEGSERQSVAKGKNSRVRFKELLYHSCTGIGVSQSCFRGGGQLTSRLMSDLGRLKILNQTCQSR